MTLGTELWANCWRCRWQKANCFTVLLVLLRLGHITVDFDQPIAALVPVVKAVLRQLLLRDCQLDSSLCRWIRRRCGFETWSTTRWRVTAKTVFDLAKEGTTPWSFTVTSHVTWVSRVWDQSSILQQSLIGGGYAGEFLLKACKRLMMKIPSHKKYAQTGSCNSRSDAGVIGQHHLCAIRS